MQPGAVRSPQCLAALGPPHLLCAHLSSAILSREEKQAVSLASSWHFTGRHESECCLALLRPLPAHACTLAPPREGPPESGSCQNPRWRNCHVSCPGREPQGPPGRLTSDGTAPGGLGQGGYWDCEPPTHLQPPGDPNHWAWGSRNKLVFWEKKI